jgi:hypothetical protein
MESGPIGWTAGMAVASIAQTNGVEPATITKPQKKAIAAAL